MPWNERSTMSMKEDLIENVINGERSVSQVAREMGISRKTAYKWIARYKEEGVLGLQEKSRAPLCSPGRIATPSVDLILKTRSKFPAWGGRKLRKYLENEGHTDLPSESSINRILNRFGKILDEDSKKRKPWIRFERKRPNELWQMDFKGHFELGNSRCHPLTVLDDHSRFSICLRAYKGETLESVQEGLTEAFIRYGLPEAMTMDNGSPWKGSYPHSMSRLTVWLSRLGIRVGHSTPRHPQTQGKDERFHRSLKEELLRYHRFHSFEEAQSAFDEWRDIYNYKRPHEGIGMERPGDRYKPSTRQFPEILPEIEYQESDLIRKVRSCGQISHKGIDIFVGEALYGEKVALRKFGEGLWDVYFCKSRVCRFREK